MDPKPVSGINRVVLPGETLDGPAVPDSFSQSLRQYDPTLLVTWNARRKRFVVEQCVEHLNPASATEHSHLCRRIYVVMAQDEEDQTMIPLGEKVMEMIRARDVTKLGFGPEDTAKFIKKATDEIVEHTAKVDKKCAEIVRDCRKDNKRQLRKAIHLMQQHSLEVNQ
jgi:hypothetical protein